MSPREDTHRRSLRFSCMADILEDVERLAAGEIRTTGDWSAGKIIHHVADGIHISLLPPPERESEHPAPGAGPPDEVRRRKELLLRRGLPEGVEQPAVIAARAPEGDIRVEEAVAHLRRALERAETETMAAAHPMLGPLTHDEWAQFHCRHAELHFSFMQPSS